MSELNSSKIQIICFNTQIFYFKLQVQISKIKKKPKNKKKMFLLEIFISGEEETSFCKKSLNCVTNSYKIMSFSRTKMKERISIHNRRNERVFLFNWISIVFNNQSKHLAHIWNIFWKKRDIFDVNLKWMEGNLFIC